MKPLFSPGDGGEDMYAESIDDIDSAGDVVRLCQVNWDVTLTRLETSVENKNMVEIISLFSYTNSVGFLLWVKNYCTVLLYLFLYNTMVFPRDEFFSRKGMFRQ